MAPRDDKTMLAKVKDALFAIAVVIVIFLYLIAFLLFLIAENLIHVMEQMPDYFPETRIYILIIFLALISFLGPYRLLGGKISFPTF